MGNFSREILAIMKELRKQMRKILDEDNKP
jgi:hypothetical protein